MSKQYETLYVFGDSFSTPFYEVDPKDSYWGLLANHADIPNVVNYSFGGNAWEGVMQSLIGVSSGIDFQTSLIIVAIPPLERRLRFDNYQNTEHLFYTFNQNWDSFPVPNEHMRGLEVLSGFRKGSVRDEISLFADRSWLETVLMRELFLVTKWLDSIDANYFIINTNAKDLDKENFWGPSATVLPYMLDHPRMMFEDTYHSINQEDNIQPADYGDHGWMGHHGPEGNANFFQKSLLPQLKDAKLL